MAHEVVAVSQFGVKEKGAHIRLKDIVHVSANSFLYTTQSNLWKIKAVVSVFANHQMRTKQSDKRLNDVVTVVRHNAVKHIRTHQAATAVACQQLNLA